MISKIISIFKKTKSKTNPTDDFQVGYEYDHLIKNPEEIVSYSICMACLEIVKNSTQGNTPDEYWCCPDCASEAIEIPYENLPTYLSKHSGKEIEKHLRKWRSENAFRESYKKIKEIRYLKLIELSNNTMKITQIQENEIRYLIIEVMRDEVKYKKSKIMYCCNNLTKKVAKRLDGINQRQVWKIMRKMISQKIILCLASEPPIVMLNEHYDDLLKISPELALKFKK